MSGTQKKRANARPAMPWLSLCAALVGVGALLLLQDRSRVGGSRPSRTAGSSTHALRQALFGTQGAATELVSGTSTATSGEPDTAGIASGGFDAAASPVSASEAAVNVQAGSLGDGEPEVAGETRPAAEPASAPADRPVH